MTQQSALQNIFEGRGHSFQEIIIGGYLGGQEALLRYSRARRSHFHRIAQKEEHDTPTAERAYLAYNALHEAMNVIQLISPMMKAVRSNAVQQS